MRGITPPSPPTSCLRNRVPSTYFSHLTSELRFISAAAKTHLFTTSPLSPARQIKHPRVSGVDLLNTSNWPTCQFLLPVVTRDVWGSLKHTLADLMLVSHTCHYTLSTHIHHRADDIHVTALAAMSNS